MSVVATFELGLPLFRDTFESLPSVELKLEAVNCVMTEGDGDFQPEADEGPVGDDEGADGATVVYFYWVSGLDFEADPDAFDRVFEADPDVTDQRRLAALPDRQLYRFRLTDVGRRASLYDAAAAADAVALDFDATAERFRIRARFPDCGALTDFRAAAAEREVRFSLDRLVNEDGTPGTDPLLTAKQREALVDAWEAGYFDTPRRVTLGDIATGLDVSDQAVSQRLRRAVATLVETTVVDEPRTDRAR
ncbi:helix-turn-helix domain-containing protein [Halobium salinum]|uniref:Helix-turn-helix domain-containing protein n=1 Tax=Halobium salinum TaxID=1364940 RepID=A0ABD5PCZ7_9EURY|nr:helix-turn-helix domain-containing protein [Halobium salinum]